MRLYIVTLWLFCIVFSANAQRTSDREYKTRRDISYLQAAETNTYRLDRCKLDIYYPAKKKDFQTLIWFHGGGLEGGEKYFPAPLLQQGFAIVAVNYRLSPQATHPAYLEDAAEAIAWIFRQIETIGGSPDKIYIGGHSAGAYLALMMALDKSYLEKYEIDANRIQGVLAISAQTNTHYTIRKEQNLPADVPVIDQYAPLNKVRKDAPFLLLITGDRELELPARYEENAHLAAVLKGMGNNNCKLIELQGFDHGTVVSPACELFLHFLANLPE